MSGNSKIEWTEKTWNPIVGCSILSPGCTNCYAMGEAARQIRCAKGLGRTTHYEGTVKDSKAGPVWTGKLALAPEHILTEPLRRKKPTMWFVNSMSDLFHENVPDEWIDRVFAVMALSRQHTFQVLTKRSARMRAYLRSRNPVALAVAFEIVAVQNKVPKQLRVIETWPLPNVWLGVSAERQQEADVRIPDLLATPAAVRFVSAEPLLGPIDFEAVKYTHAPGFFGSALRWHHRGHCHEQEGLTYPRLDWIIVGGESGSNARPMHPDWARSIRDQCTAAGTAFFFKQWGEWAPEYPHPVGCEAGALDRMTTVASTERKRIGETSYLAGSGLDKPSTPLRRVGKARAGRLLDGRTWDEYPSTATHAGGDQSEHATAPEPAA